VVLNQIRKGVILVSITLIKVAEHIIFSGVKTSEEFNEKN